MGSSIRAASFDEDTHFMLIEVDDKQVGFQAISEAGLSLTADYSSLQMGETEYGVAATCRSF